jgi:hypothetical protein
MVCLKYDLEGRKMAKKYKVEKELGNPSPLGMWLVFVVWLAMLGTGLYLIFN